MLDDAIVHVETKANADAVGFIRMYWRCSMDNHTSLVGFVRFWAIMHGVTTR
jgi:hypothetical protein